MKYLYRMKAFILLAAMLPLACFADNSNDSGIGDYPDRIISLVYLMRGDLYYSPQHESSVNREKFDEILNLMSEQEQKKDNFYILGMLTQAKHLCHVELVDGFFCDLSWPVKNDIGGYLFITDSFRAIDGDYILLLYSGIAPERTVILRIKRKHAELIYDSFQKENSCTTKADWPALRILHLVKVISDSTIQISEDSYHHSAQNHDEPPRTFQIKIGASNCVLTQVVNP